MALLCRKGALSIRVSKEEDLKTMVNEGGDVRRDCGSLVWCLRGWHSSRTTIPALWVQWAVTAPRELDFQGLNSLGQILASLKSKAAASLASRFGLEWLHFQLTSLFARRYFPWTTSCLGMWSWLRKVVKHVWLKVVPMSYWHAYSMCPSPFLNQGHYPKARIRKQFQVSERLVLLVKAFMVSQCFPYEMCSVYKYKDEFLSTLGFERQAEFFPSHI